MASGKPESKLIKAAGAVAWRPGPDGRPEILLVHRRKYDDWSLPKGKVEPGEALPITAVREVLEEGGARLALGRRLSSVRYNVGGRPKRVHYWSAAVASVDEHAVPNDEIDKVEWIGADRAAERISYNRDNGVIADFTRLPAQTVPVILLRHAKAVAKSHWKRADDRRPLDDAGRADAKTLAELLACFGPGARLITSPAARCVETLRPLAERSGAELREEPSLYIHTPSSRTDPADSPTSIAALLAEAVAAGEPTIFCAHRENIPDLQAAALALVDPDALPDLPNEWDDPLPTSGFWVLNLAHPAPLPTSPAPVASVPGSRAPGSPAPVASGSGTPAPGSPAPMASASGTPVLPTPGPSAPAALAASTAPPSPAWRRWLHLHLRPRARPPAAAPAGPAAPAPPLAAPVFVHEDTAIAPNPAGPPLLPAPCLVSADRYDLSEL